MTWRAATIEDAAAIIRLWEVTDRLLGKQDKPMLFARPVMLTMVAEDPNGKIVDAFYVEATVDITKIGASRRGFEGTIPIAEDIRAWLKSRGIHMARICVPLSIVERMSEGLKTLKFWPSNGLLSHWVRRL